MARSDESAAAPLRVVEMGRDTGSMAHGGRRDGAWQGIGKERPVTCSFARVFLPHLRLRLTALDSSTSWQLPFAARTPQTSQSTIITTPASNTAPTSLFVKSL